MSILIKGKSGIEYSFSGPWSYISTLDDKSGVYAIICDNDGTLNLLDVGESSTIKSRIEKHDRADQWTENCTGELKYAQYLTEHGKKPTRMEIEQDIRDNYDLPCGER